MSSFVRKRCLSKPALSSFWYFIPPSPDSDFLGRNMQRANAKLSTVVVILILYEPRVMQTSFYRTNLTCTEI